MATVILQCNEREEPEVRDWIKEVQEELQEEGFSDWTWSCGNVRQIQVGDRIFFQRTGKSPRGYFASGYTIAAPTEEQLRLQDPNYKDLSEAYHNTFYGNGSFKIYLEIETIVDFDLPLEIDYLKQLPQFQGCNFTRFGGGTAFNANYVDFLEEEWKKHSLRLFRQGQGTRLIDVHCLQGATYIKNKQFEDAYDEYSAALTLAPNHPQARIGLGNALYSLGIFDEAIIEYTKAILLESKFDKVAYYKRALAYCKIKDYNSAVEDYSKVIQNDSKCLEAFFGLGDAYYKKKQYKAAIDVYSKVIQIDGNQAKAYLNRAKTYIKLNESQFSEEELQFSREDLQKVLELSPQLSDKVDPLLNDIESIEIINLSNTVDLSNSEFKHLSDKEREAIVKVRIGQGRFRKLLVGYWGTCAVTKCREHSLLRASHIKPWAKCNSREAIDLFNGLLLTPSLDAAFDEGYISFDEFGAILISQTLSESDATNLGIHASLCLNRIDPKHQPYLAYHRQNIFKG